MAMHLIFVYQWPRIFTSTLSAPKVALHIRCDLALVLWPRLSCLLSKSVTGNQLTLAEEQGVGGFDKMLFSVLVHESRQKSFQKTSALVKIEKMGGTVGLRIRPDCSEEIDRNHNWQVTDLNIYWLQLSMHTYSSVTCPYFDLAHTPSQDVTNASMLHTLSLLRKHTQADVTQNFSDFTLTHADVTDTPPHVDRLVLFTSTPS